MLCTASSQTKDCLELLKLVGVPVIKVHEILDMHSLRITTYSIHTVLVLCLRLQEMLRHCVLILWERGAWMQWRQRTWIRCHLEALLLFAIWMPRRAGGSCAIVQDACYFSGIFRCIFQTLCLYIMSCTISVDPIKTWWAYINIYYTLKCEKEA